MSDEPWSSCSMARTSTCSATVNRRSTAPPRSTTSSTRFGRKPRQAGSGRSNTFSPTTRACSSTPSKAPRKRCAAIIINGGAFTHYSWALHDALAAYEGYVVEVHISNPQARESWRHTSVITPVADGAIIGMGPLGYRLALQAVDQHLRSPEAE